MYRPPEVHIPDDTFQSADEAVPACGYGQNQFQEFFQVIPDRSMHDNNPNWLSSAQHIRCQFHEDHSVSDLSVFAPNRDHRNYHDREKHWAEILDIILQAVSVQCSFCQLC